MYSRTRGEGFGPEVKRRILLGTCILRESRYESYYLQALRVRTLIRSDYEAAFNRFDLLLGAVTPTTAFKLGEKKDDPVAMYHADICLLPGPWPVSRPSPFPADLARGGCLSGSS